MFRAVYSSHVKARPTFVFLPLLLFDLIKVLGFNSEFKLSRLATAMTC